MEVSLKTLTMEELFLKAKIMLGGDVEKKKELKRLKKEYKQYILDIGTMENGHFKNCVWSNPQCESGPDTCRCCFLEMYPDRLKDRIIALVFF